MSEQNAVVRVRRVSRKPRLSSKSARAREVWRRLFGFILATASQRDRVLYRLDLSAGDGRALGSLDHSAPRSMGSLATEWRCDASTATRIVDRLERAGLVERRSFNGDRRVRAVVLTSKGVRVKAKHQAGLFEPPPELMRLSADQLEALQDALQPLPEKPSTPLAPPAWERRRRKGPPVKN